MISLVIMLACVVLAYRYADTENLSGPFWATASLVLWFASAWLLPANILGLIALQLAMLVSMRFLAIRQNNC